MGVTVTIRARAPEADAGERAKRELLDLGCPQCKIVPLGVPHICNEFDLGFAFEGLVATG
jgi:hypothetical protein